jgi:hypothetical protein
VDRAADILCRDKRQDRHLAGLGIDLDIAELYREAGRHAAGIDRGRGGGRAAGRRLLGRQFLERQRREIADVAARRPSLAVLPGDALNIELLARDMKRSQVYLASEAIEAYLDLDA